jgi:predicted nucleic acid-binding protein
MELLLKGRDTLLDSVILIDYLNEWTDAVDYVESNQATLVTSAVTVAEVLVGVDSDGEEAVLRMLGKFPSLDVTRTVARRAALLRREHGWKLPDAFQAGVAQEFGLYLATRNTNDFDPSAHDFVTVPYTLPPSR